MRRGIEELSNDKFDVLVVGGGIQGIAILYTLTQQGIKAGLIERDDFASGTSANSLRVIHGGLRYLQTGDLGRMRRSIKARRQFMQLAPSLVRPQGFLIPTSKRGLLNPALMRVALFLNDLISSDRNQGLASTNRLPPGKILPNCDFVRPFSGSVEKSFQSGALWFDSLIHDAGRFSIELIKSAQRDGAVVCNYVRAEKYLRRQGKVCGVEAIDRESGDPFSITAKVVVEVAGAGRAKLNNNTTGDFDRTRRTWLKATNLVLSKTLNSDHAIGLSGIQKGSQDNNSLVQQSRYFFFVPYSGCTLFGTFYSVLEEIPDDLSVTQEEINSMLAQAQLLCPEENLTLNDVKMSHVGVVPAGIGSAEKFFTIEKRSSINTKALDGFEGLISVQGVKYTESFQVADEVSRVVGSRLGHRYRQLKPCAVVGLETCLTTSIADLARRAVHDEMAVHLTDFILRRTTLGEVGCPDRRLVQDYAVAMASEADWSAKRIDSEVTELYKYYESRGVRET
ncbi:MAG: FAD-dependent oxidoreductase [Proteobacteria bacterium]|nr:FAD-dependent oxidoreductase [Pseudomonadota bacterium]